MQRTKIEWVKHDDGSRGHSLNITSGCLHACRDTYCYAARQARRFGKTEHARKFMPDYHPERMEQARRRKKPTTIFLGSASDMWGRWVPDEQLDAIMKMVRDTPQHRYLTLTKNPARYLSQAKRGWLPYNLWCGATATDQEAADWAVEVLGQLGNKTFISCEPIQGSIVLDPRAGRGNRLGWLIVGAEIGPGIKEASSDEKKHAWRLFGQAAALDIPLFIKDNLGRPRAPQQIPWME